MLESFLRISYDSKMDYRRIHLCIYEGTQVLYNHVEDKLFQISSIVSVVHWDITKYSRVEKGFNA